MLDKILITTTVSLDCDGNEPQKVIHLQEGDYGARALRLIPVLNGRLIDMEAAGVIAAKVELACPGQEDLLINCELGDTWATLVPTPAMVSSADQWAAQLILYTGQDPDVTLRTWPFIVNVHGGVYAGDAVEHTDNWVVAAYYQKENDQYTGKLVLEMSNGDTYVTDETVQGVHTHGLATAPDTETGTEGADGFMSAEDKEKLDGLDDLFDQSVKTTASPTFAGLTVGELEIGADGTITGARFA